MFLLKQIIKLIRLLHKDEGILLLSIGFSLGIFSGLAGFGSILGALSLLIALVFRVQLGAYLFSTAFFALISLPLFDTFNQVGNWLLNMEGLKPLWTWMYQQALFHWLDFNNTLTMGANICALIAFPFVFFLTHFLILKYQKTVLTKLKKSRIYQGFMKSAPAVLYQKYLRQIEV